jgi:L-rhamnose-H+ transport protein
MNPVTPNPLLGVAMHAIGALFAATCYTPQKKVKGWSWQTYWLTQAAFCWFLLPLLGAWLTIPQLMDVLREAPHAAMRNSFLLGMVYGIGGTAFGIAIRYIGFSLTYAIAIGLSSVLGTLIPTFINGISDFLQTPGAHPFLESVQAGFQALSVTFSKTGGEWVLSGIIVGTLGIAITGAAGRMKESDLTAQKSKGEFSLVKGLLISILAGVLSAVYGFALTAGKPIAEVASIHGAGEFRGNVVYIFSNTGAFLTTAIYCLCLHRKHKTLGELVELPAGTEKASLPVNFLMAVITGCLWYGQFFFYNLGNVRMGRFEFTSWAIHMTMLVLFSSVVGIVLREWRGCRRMTDVMIAVALLVLVGAVLLLTYGNYLGEAIAN